MHARRAGSFSSICGPRASLGFVVSSNNMDRANERLIRSGEEKELDRTMTPTARKDIYREGCDSYILDSSPRHPLISITLQHHGPPQARQTKARDAWVSAWESSQAIISISSFLSFEKVIRRAHTVCVPLFGNHLLGHYSRKSEV